MSRHIDVLIIGAGLSGIGMACHLTRETKRDYLILERRESVGGTWDLFQYPGIRSDSDMYTFGYSFRPWTGTKILSDGRAIKQYIQDTATEYDVTRRIRFGRGVTAANRPAPNSAGRFVPRLEPPAKPKPTHAISSSCAADTTTTTTGSAQGSPVRTSSPAGSCIRNTGRRTWTPAANESS